jgi:hypothetical protein
MNDKLLSLLGQFFSKTQVPRSLGAFRRGAFYPEIERLWDEIRYEAHIFGWATDVEAAEAFRKELAP